MLSSSNLLWIGITLRFILFNWRLNSRCLSDWKLIRCTETGWLGGVLGCWMGADFLIKRGMEWEGPINWLGNTHQHSSWPDPPTVCFSPSIKTYSHAIPVMDQLFKCKNRKNVLRRGFEVLLRKLLIGSLVKSVKSKGYTETPEMATFDSEYQEKFVTSLTLTCQKKQENS